MSNNDEQSEVIVRGWPKVGKWLRQFGGHIALIAVLAATSVLLLSWAVTREPLAPVLLPLGLGAAVGGAALWVAARLMRRATHQRRIAVGCVLLGAVVTVIGVRTVNPWLAPLGLVVLMLGVIAAYESLAHSNRTAPRCSLAVGLVLLPGSTLLVAAAPVGTTVAGVAMWLAGLIAFKLGVTRYIRSVDVSSPDEWHERIHARSLVTLGSSVVAAAIGVVLLLLSPRLPDTQMGPIYVVVGVTLLVGGLSAAGLAAFNLEPQPDPKAPAQHARAWRSVLAAGVVVAAVGGLWVRWVLPHWGELSLIVFGVALVVGVFFVWRGEGIVFLVMVGFLLAWVLVDRTEEPEQVAAADSEGVIVALGDSFTAGQGTNRYSELTNTQASTGNTCRRSPRSFATLLGLQLNREVLNYACNGAKIRHITTEGQRRDDLKTSQVPGPLPQLDNLMDPEFGPEDVADVDLVLLGGGGNNAQFSTVVMACALPPDCSIEGDRFQAEIDLISEELREVYKQTRDAMPGVPIVVLPYPNYVGDERCELSLSTDELDFADKFLRRLNATIAQAVDDFGDERVRYFPLMDQAYEGRQLCDDEPAANFIRLVPNEGSIFQRLNPLTWHEATMHPNDIGHRCTAAAMTPWLLGQFDELTPRADHEPPVLDCDLAEPDEPSNAESLPALDESLFLSPPEGGRCVEGIEGAEEPNGCFDEDKWVANELHRTAQQLAPPIALLIVAGMLTALAIARLRLDWPVLKPYIPDPPSFTPTRRIERR